MIRKAKREWAGVTKVVFYEFEELDWKTPHLRFSGRSSSLSEIRRFSRAVRVPPFVQFLLIERFNGQMAKERYVSPFPRALIYVGLRERAKALDWLERSFEDQDVGCYFLKVDPVYDGMRDEPRFQALLKKVGLDK